MAGTRSSVIEKLFIYFPERTLEGDPTSWGMPFEDVRFVTDDGVELHGWFVPGRRQETWLWLHGNAGNISHRLENLKFLHDQVGVNVFIFDYRGYGQSRGSPSERGTYRDATAALDYLRSRGDVHEDRIIYFGRSLGAAVAVELATRHLPAGLVLESPFPSVSYMAKRTHLWLPVWPLLRGRYDSLARIGEIHAPVLVVHGDSDSIVPIEGARILFEAANEPREFYAIRGADHNDTYSVGGRGYFTTLTTFLDRLEDARR